MSSFSDYVSSYKNFTAPAFEILIDGASLNKTLGISSVTVDLSTGETANGCSFSLANVFNHKNHSITSEVNNKIKLGKLVKVSIGYASSLTSVFTGYINSIAYSFDASGGPSINVTCLDGRALMKKSAKRKVNLDKKIDSIVSEIFDDYKPVIKSVNASLEALEQDEKLQLDTNDLNFIVSLANARNRYFYILDDVAYISEKDTSSSFTYDFINSIFSLNFTMNYLDVTYEAIVNEKKGEAPITVTSTAKQPGEQVNPINKQMKEIYKLKEKSQGDAQKTNQAKADNASRDCQSGSISSVGLPALLPGKNITIRNFPVLSMSNQDLYCIKSVKHVIDTNGFITTVTFGLGV